MQVLLTEQIEQIYDWLSSLDDEEETARLVEEFSEKQPMLFTYLLTMGEEDFDADENELMFFLGLLIWHSHLHAGNLVPLVAENDLDGIQEQNVKMLEYLADESESGFITVARHLLEESEQPQLLRFLVQVIFEDEADIISPANQGIMFIFLKVVVDAMQRRLTGKK